MIYLDHNATTNVCSEVWNKMTDINAYGPINPSSVHLYGQKGKSLIEEARRSIAYLLGFDMQYLDYQIVFTASGTEANNLIISNFRNYEIFISAIEHTSIYEHIKYLPNISIINVDKHGILDIEDLVVKLSNSTSNKKLLSVMIANNDTGIIQPIQKICKIAHHHGALMHSDCTQAIGKIDVNMLELDLDFLTISGHKFGGPMGAGALIARTSYNLKPQIIGGGQEKTIRSGTENVPAIVGLGVAAQLVKQDLFKRYVHMVRLQYKLETMLLTNKYVVDIVGNQVKRLPNTSLIINLNYTAEIHVVLLDLKGIAVSAGSACSSGKSSPSHVLSAMGYSEDKIYSAVRISIGVKTTKEDINQFIAIYNQISK